MEILFVIGYILFFIVLPALLFIFVMRCINQAGNIAADVLEENGYLPPSKKGIQRRQERARRLAKEAPIEDAYLTYIKRRRQWDPIEVDTDDDFERVFANPN